MRRRFRIGASVASAPAGKILAGHDRRRTALREMRGQQRAWSYRVCGLLSTVTVEAWADFERAPYRVTLDTCCINVRRQNQDLNAIELWAEEEKLVLQRAEAMLDEIRGEARVSKAAAMPPHPGLFTLGVSTLGGPDVLAGPDMEAELEAVLFPTSATLTPNQRHDVEHLRKHIRTGGDVFVTLNPNDFITRGRQERFGSEQAVADSFCERVPGVLMLPLRHVA